MKVVLAAGLAKSFASVEAVRGVSFAVEKGEVYGLLGPNGAGKTTTMRMLTGLTPLGGGTLRVLGLAMPDDAREIKRRIGVVPQESNLDNDMRVDDQLLAHARFYDVTGAAGRERVARLLAAFELREKAAERVQNLSGGMKRRLLLARALLNDPELIVMDEPTVGLDPQSRHLLWERIRDLRRDGRTVILSTHYMDEAEALCDRLAIMDRGRILEEGTPRALIEKHLAREALEIDAPRADHDAIRAAAGVPGESVGERLILHAHDAEELLARVRAAGLAPRTALVRRATLEDVFLNLTGRALGEE